MSPLPRRDLVAARAIAELNYTNPFTPRRLELERIALGTEFEPEELPFWSHSELQNPQRRRNVVHVAAMAKTLLQRLRSELLKGSSRPEDEQRNLYVDLAYFVLFDELLDVWEYPLAIHRDWDQRSVGSSTAEIWKRYSGQFDYWLKLPGVPSFTDRDKCHLFSIFHQIYRAFFNIFYCVIGKSLPAAKLRSQIWESIFTVNLRRYRDSLYQHLPEVTTLITGPSGSGKELVARAIGLSRYIPFERSTGQFRTDFSASYSAINISAFSSNLVESELFGHAKGAFTGADSSRAGWLESCGQDGSILLDEIGELELTTQVKLLRVLQNREFQRTGESKTRKFEGKLIAATNRDLQAEIEKKNFREDLYYRLCADVIETPSLQAQVQDNPGVLENLVGFIVQRMLPEVQKEMTAEIVDWLETHLPKNYGWPGNFRELEQCVRNLMIHGGYRFQAKQDGTTVGSSTSNREPEIAKLVQQIAGLELTADELTSAYCKIAYRKTRSFEKAAHLLQLDRRTVRKKSDSSNA
jgi:sigma-54 dependent transcriptional regulator, flagellar regulatory protein